jgi:Ca2+-binding RTX toxin-like protein
MRSPSTSIRTRLRFGVYSGFENIAGATADNIITVTASTNGGTINTGSAADVTSPSTRGTDTVNTGDGGDTVMARSSGPTWSTSMPTTTPSPTVTAWPATCAAVRVPTPSPSPGRRHGQPRPECGGRRRQLLRLREHFRRAADDSITATASTVRRHHHHRHGRRTPVTLNSGTDIVSTGDGGDTVTGTLGGADVVDLQGGADTFGYQDSLAGDVRGGLGSDTLLIEAADGVVNLDLNAGTGFGSYNGFENISGSAADDSITVTASTAGGTITTGTVGDSVTLNSGTDIVSTGNGADTVTGTLDALDVVDLQGDNDSFDYQVLVGDVRGGSGFDTLVIDAADGAVTLDLNDTFAPGAYSDFENIDGTTANDIITVIASTDGGSITTGSAADAITLNTGNDIVLAGLGTDTIRATASTLTLGDNIDGQGGNDTLAITGGGTVSMLVPVAVSSIEFVTLADSVTFIANNTVGLTITGSGDADTITLGNVLQNVDAEAGDDSITMGAGSQTINGMAGNDIVHATGAQLVGSQITGGDDSDTLDITSTSANMNDAAVLTGFEFVTLSASGTTFTANGLNLTITGSGGADIITLGSGVQVVNAANGNDSITLGAAGQTVNGQANDDAIYATGAQLVGSTIDGGADSDTLYITSNSANMNSGSITAIEFVTLQVSGTTLVANNLDALVITGSAGGDTITTGDATGTEQTVNAGAGNDGITLGAAGQTINGQADDDTVHATGAQLVGATIDGGTETTADTLDITSTSANMNDATSIINFEYVTLSVSGTTFTANGDDTLTIFGSTGGDTITLGHQSQNVNAGTGDDVIVATDAQFDLLLTIDGGGETSADTLRISDRATLADAGFATVVDVETLELAYTGGTGTQSVTLADANAGVTGIATLDADASIVAVTVNASGLTSALAIFTGSAGDSITLGAAASSVTSGSGNDTVNVNGTTIASTINGGGDTDTLNVTSSSANMNAGTITGIELVTLSVPATTFTANNLALTITGSGGADNITLGGAVQTVNAGAGGDDITLGFAGQTANGEGDDDRVFATGAQLVGATIDGGAHGTGDTLLITDTSANMNDGTITAIEFVTLSASGTTLIANDLALTINGSGGADIITTGNAVQTVNAGAGNDSITLGAAGQTINGQADDDTVHATGAQLAGATLDGGGHSVGDTLDITDTSANMTLGTISNFEFVTLSASGTTFIADGDTTLAITGSTGSDIITLGAATQTVNAMATATTSSLSPTRCSTPT